MSRRRPLRRARMLLPHPAFILIYALCYLAASLPALMVAHRMGPAMVDASLRRGPVLVHLAGALLYGAYRAAAFHPFFRPGYRQWLETTPWAWGKPLPFGPAHLVFEDAVILAAMGLPGWLSGDVPPEATYAVALGGYLLALAPSFARTGAWGFQYAVLAGVGLAVGLARGRPESYAAAALVAYPIGLIGLRRSFRRWPWPDPGPSPILVLYESLADHPPQARTPARLGWPFDRLGPRTDGPPGRLDAPGKLLSALVAGWWCHAIIRVLPDEQELLFVMQGMMIYLLIFMIGLYLVSMITGHDPPIRLAGRIARLRPLVPSYDRVFLPPIAAALAIVAGPRALVQIGVPPDVALAACVALMVAAIRLGGPDRRTWQLTAQARVVPGISNNANKNGEFIQIG